VIIYLIRELPTQILNSKVAKEVHKCLRQKHENVQPNEKKDLVVIEGSINQHLSHLPLRF
jgi:hypothetical protein